MYYADMAYQSRSDSGTFEAKGDAPRAVRSLRLTDDCYAALGRVAQNRGQSRADMLESMAQDGYLDAYQHPDKEAMELLLFEIASDPSITRGGKDAGSCKRMAREILKRLYGGLYK